MASTNKTTNYELSQYIGTDKPTYLGDYNGDMLKIDTQMKANADAAAAADSKATTASTNAGTALTNAGTAITNAGTAQNTAENAQTTATTALGKATQNESDIVTLTNQNNYTVNDEIVIGKLGNDNIYRKVISFQSTLPIGDTHIAHGITNRNLCLRHDLIAEGEYLFPYSTAAAKFVTLVQFTTTDIIIRNQTGDTWSPTPSNFWVILEYTKTA